jgi:hypothetical protein
LQQSSKARAKRWCTVHARCILQRSFVFSSRHNFIWSGTHDFSLDGAHRFSALCLRVAIAILPCMSERKGEKWGGVEMKTAAICHQGVPCRCQGFMGGSLAAGITFYGRTGAKGLKNWEGETCSRHNHDYHHGGDRAARGQRW